MNLTELRAQALQLHGIVQRHYGRPVTDVVTDIEPLVLSMPRPPNLDESQFNSADYKAMLRFAHFSARWAENGCPAFFLSHGLAAKLLLTDCSKVAYGELKWPFETFVVLLPHPSPLFTLGPAGEPTEVSVVQFHRYRPPPPEEGHGLFVATFDGSGTSVHRAIHETDAEHDIELFLTQDTRPDDVRFLGTGVEFSDLDSSALQASLRLIVNLVLYLGDLQATEQWYPDRPNQGLGQRQAKQGKPVTDRQWVLGQDIKLSAELRHAASNRTQASAQWKLDARFLVRGHWRNQPFGPGRQQRRRQWIDPFWKGPEAGHRILRDYKLEDT